MKIKKYIADTMPEAMNEIRKDFGREAVILQSKEIKQKGFLGLFQKKRIEVIAAHDPDPIKRGSKPLEAKEIKMEQTSKTQSDLQTIEPVLKEIRNLKNLIELEAAKDETKLPALYQLALQQLLDQEVEKTLAEAIIEKTISFLADEGSEVTETNIANALKQVIRNELNGLSFQGITGEQQIVQFVGPTGVGKTTTIAKIAAKLILQEKKKVAFITTDTYRIAAVEQLKTYARILNVPLEVAYQVDDYRQAIETFTDYDVILVDTAGRNFREKAYISQLKEMLEDVPSIATYLVLALTTKPKDVQDLFEQFQDIPLTEMIFTKMDETTQYGSILSIALNNRIGIAYLTNGQDVPDDLVKPTPTLISDLIVEQEDD
ncbi:flagellar biosynthesis protein FlhF [Oceanobacillus indicireducens]|uniref:Flagellar biosynthesis protein FlhF n=1 Tax=Oceanobacillus indicireducens TaxID=1004261 RepID=A0A917XR99_9BACI|nr:flagellar biosynthesis protein FlhF [Oceanobacillus indicireducens]GGN49816.1 flagellar biosynthesis protein FlhF [Oceanobacillus indicireducens]